MVDGGDPLTVTALELGAGTLALTLLAPLMPMLVPAFAGPLLVAPAPIDAFWLVLLALACTLLPFALCLVALRHLSAFTAQLSVNLEPVYAIALAAVLFAEQQELDGRFYAGVAIILAVVFVQGLLAGRRASRPAEHAELLGVSESKQVAE